MTRYIAIIEIWLKENLVDAEGETVKEALNDLGYHVLTCKVGKTYKLLIDATDDEEANKIVDEICKRLLANPVKDIYYFNVKKYEI